MSMIQLSIAFILLVFSFYIKLRTREIKSLVTFDLTGNMNRSKLICFH